MIYAAGVGVFGLEKKTMPTEQPFKESLHTHAARINAHLNEIILNGSFPRSAASIQSIPAATLQEDLRDLGEHLDQIVQQVREALVLFPAGGGQKEK